MGLTAVAPVTHGLWLYGFDKMYKQIGLPWLVTQGLLYLFGASIYAASFRTQRNFDSKLTFIRPEYPNDGDLAHLTYGGAHIRFFMFW